jgi:hypothetical protein
VTATVPQATAPRCQTDTDIFQAGIRAASQLPPASPGAVQRVAQILACQLQQDNRTERDAPAA